jgi:hypothetical protein
MSDSALSVRYRKFRYQAQSDIADHGYRTKCPPMVTALESDEVVTVTHRAERSHVSGELVLYDIPLPKQLPPLLSKLSLYLAELSQ